VQDERNEDMEHFILIICWWIT